MNTKELLEHILEYSSNVLSEVSDEIHRQTRRHACAPTNRSVNRAVLPGTFLLLLPGANVALSGAASCSRSSVHVQSSIR